MIAAFRRLRVSVETLRRFNRWSLSGRALTCALAGIPNSKSALLTPDFTEIMRNGDIKDLSAELALAAKNRPKPLPLGDLPSGQVLLHGNVAVAYGRSTGARAMRYADYYVWENGQWRVYFAQQTDIAADPQS